MSQILVIDTLKYLNKASVTYYNERILLKKVLCFIPIYILESSTKPTTK